MIPGSDQNEALGFRSAIAARSRAMIVVARRTSPSLRISWPGVLNADGAENPGTRSEFGAGAFEPFSKNAIGVEEKGCRIDQHALFELVGADHGIAVIVALAQPEPHSIARTVLAGEDARFEPLGPVLQCRDEWIECPDSPAVRAGKQQSAMA